MEQSIFKSLEIIEARILEKLTVDNLAASLHFSKFHYQRIFREIVGDSVMSYITKRKLTLAGKELLETDASILDIALKFGFETHEGFTRSFKSFMGVTPRNYRKYSLSAIKTGKGELIMYSKTTNEILRELNDFIAKAKELATETRKENAAHWEVLANSTNALAERVKIVLDHVTAIADRPDEITQRFAIMHAVQDAAFQSNLLAFNTGLTLSRANPVNARRHPLYEKYRQLAQGAAQKLEKIYQFMNELASLIFEDMRKTASEKITAIIQKGKIASKNITGHSNIKHEVEALINRISNTTPEEMAVSHLEDFFLQLNILSFAAEMDSTQIKGIAEFQAGIFEAIHFFKSLPSVAPIPKQENETLKNFAFQGNILLFYTRGEAEKLSVNLNEICEKIDQFIKFIHQNADTANRNQIAAMLSNIHESMIKTATALKDHGGSIKFIADEFKTLEEMVQKSLFN